MSEEEVSFLPGRMIRLKNRRVSMGPVSNGDFWVEIKRLVEGREIKETRLFLTPEAMDALVRLYFEVVKERIAEGK